MIAVVPVRDGVLPAGGDEAVAEAGGVAVVIGDGTDKAVEASVAVRTASCVEVGPYAPAAWAAALAPHLARHDIVVLPASPDGRDLAPRLAFELRRPLLAGAVEVTATAVSLARMGSLVLQRHRLDGPVVATLVPGVRDVAAGSEAPVVERLALDVDKAGDAEVVAVDPPDPATIDVAEARRILAGGGGLGGPQPFAVLARVAGALDAAHAATRLASDAGWAAHDRYIGTTGVAVDPDLYVAFGISGAVQHVTGLGQPDHIVAVNLDPSAPMMALADLAVVADARGVLVELATRLGVA